MVINLVLAALVVTASLTIGFRTYLFVQLPVLMMTATGYMEEGNVYPTQAGTPCPIFPSL